MQQTPRSAKTSAPASSIHSPLSLTAVQVKPALVVPIPVVNTDRGDNEAAYRRNCDLPVDKTTRFISIEREERTGHETNQFQDPQRAANATPHAFVTQTYPLSQHPQQELATPPAGAQPQCQEGWVTTNT